MVKAPISSKKRSTSSSDRIEKCNRQRKQGRKQSQSDVRLISSLPSSSLKELNLTNSSTNHSFLFNSTLPSSVDNRYLSLESQKSQKLEENEVGINILPKVIPIPKPKLLVNMIPESELFQKPDGGSTITPHLLRAQKEYITESPTDTTMGSEISDNSPTDKLSAEKSHKIQFGNLLKDNWNELLKSIALNPSDTIEGVTNFKGNPNTVDIGTPLSRLLVASISPPNVASEYRGSTYNVFETLGLKNSDDDDYAIIKHFFNKLLPLISASSNPDWIELSLQYVDPDLCKSCFLSLGCLHLIGYARDMTSKQELLNKSGIYINKVLDSLLNLIHDDELFDSLLDKNNDDGPINVERIVENIETQHRESDLNDSEGPNPIIFQISFLLFTHILYGILDHGRSAISRLFFKLFASLLQDFRFKNNLDLIDSSHSLISMISWWDTVSALTSPDYRLPYSNPRWLDFCSESYSVPTIELLSGCPSSLFVCMSKLCQFRQIIEDFKTTTDRKRSESEIMKLYSELRLELLDYRIYVSFDVDAPVGIEITGDPNKEYFKIRLKVAQCWSLAMIGLLLHTSKLYSESEKLVHQIVLEFIDIYSTLDLRIPIVQKLVWPLFQICLLAKDEDERDCLRIFLDGLFKKTKCLNITTLIKLVHSTWENDEGLDDILSGVQWAHAGIALLPL